MNLSRARALGPGMKRSRLPLGLIGLAWVGVAAAGLDPHPLAQEEAEQAVVRSFAEQGIALDPAAGLCALPVAVVVREDLLEYLLVGERGATHETLFATDVKPSALNAALLALGAEQGTNVREVAIEPAPSAEAVAAGASTHELALPAGDAFFLYAAWRDADEVYFFRVEDLLRNLDTGRSMQRHGWVFLGSRWVTRPGEKEPVFAADVLCNIINVAFFFEGDTILTSAIDAALNQQIWVANSWLLPERGAPATLILSRSPLERLPDGLRAQLRDVRKSPAGGADGAAERGGEVGGDGPERPR